MNPFDQAKKIRATKAVNVPFQFPDGEYLFKIMAPPGFVMAFTTFEQSETTQQILNNIPVYFHSPQGDPLCYSHKGDNVTIDYTKAGELFQLYWENEDFRDDVNLALKEVTGKDYQKLFDGQGGEDTDPLDPSTGSK